jgi:hypothetical protein
MLRQHEIIYERFIPVLESQEVILHFTSFEERHGVFHKLLEIGFLEKHNSIFGDEPS